MKRQPGTRLPGVESGASERLRRLVHRIYDLPTFPLIITKLMEVAEDPKSSSSDLAEVMEKDQGLSAKILKLVNSAFYSFSKPVSSLKHAITLVGYNSIRSLAISVSMKNLIQIESEIFDQKRFWEHSLVVALGTRLLAEMHRFPMKEDAFTAGLMHDVGILLKARYFPDELVEAREKMISRRISLCAAEEEVLGVNHTLLGAWLAEHWRLPPLLREPILRHHQLEEGPLSAAQQRSMEPEHVQVLGYVTVANCLARASGYAHNDETTFREEIVPAHLDQILLDQTFEELRVAILKRLNKSREFLSI
ncbi:MAG: HDOD domain-containing protein [Planctomycetota bacterium]